MKVVKTLSGSDMVVTCLGEELFVLHKRADNQVEVYSTNTYNPLRQFSIDGLDIVELNDMISCAQLNCLYISDFNSTCIHKSKPSGEIIARWPVPVEPLGLSLTPSNNLLAACPGSCTLLELCSKSGKCIRQVELQSPIQYPLHAMQLPNRHYFLSHTDGDDLYQVCVIDVDGHVSSSDGNQPVVDVTQLNDLYHVTTDQHDFILSATARSTELCC